MREAFYKNFDFGRTNKNVLEKQELYNLYRRPKKETKNEMGNFNQVYAADAVHQADLLFLPEDDGYKYALVVTDIATRVSDAEPLKSKNSSEVAKALQKIYARKVLKMPDVLAVDSGKEFGGDVRSYLQRNKAGLKIGKPGRHRQQAVVERTNQYFAKALFMRMQAQELLTGETSKEWVQDLPHFVKYVNQYRKREPPKVSYQPKCSGDDCDVLEIGTKVRIKLDNPLDFVTDKKLHGKIRVTDIKWDPHPRTIKNLMLLPGQPPMYMLNDEKNPDRMDSSATYTKKQLQVVSEDEEAPDPIVIRGKPTTYVVQKIVGRKKEKNRIYLKVRWKGFPPDQDTWQLRSELIKSVPQLVKDFENK